MFRALRFVVALFALVGAGSAHAVSAFNWSMVGFLEEMQDGDLKKFIATPSDLTSMYKVGTGYFNDRPYIINNGANAFSTIVQNLIISRKYTNEELHAYYKTLEELKKLPTIQWPNVSSWDNASKASCYRKVTGEKLYIYTYAYNSQTFNYALNFNDTGPYQGNESGSGESQLASRLDDLCLDYISPGDYLTFGLGFPRTGLIDGVRDMLQQWLKDSPSQMGATYLEWQGAGPPTPTEDVLCTPTLCAGYTAPGTGTGTEPGTGGTGGTGSTPTTCTTAAGRTTTNQYECAPSDTDTKCGVLDIPCNLKKLFIPDPEDIKNILSASNLTQQMGLPVTVADEWCFQLKLPANTENTNACIDWRPFMPPEPLKQLFGLLVWFGMTGYVLRYIGLPNPLGESRPESSPVSGGMNSSSYKENGRHNGNGFGGYRK